MYQNHFSLLNLESAGMTEMFLEVLALRKSVKPKPSQTMSVCRGLPSEITMTLRDRLPRNQFLEPCRRRITFTFPT